MATRDASEHCSGQVKVAGPVKGMSEWRAVTFRVTPLRARLRWEGVVMGGRAHPQGPAFPPRWGRNSLCTTRSGRLLGPPGAGWDPVLRDDPRALLWRQRLLRTADFSPRERVGQAGHPSLRGLLSWGQV